MKANKLIFQNVKLFILKYQGNNTTSKSPCDMNDKSCPDGKGKAVQEHFLSLISALINA